MAKEFLTNSEVAIVKGYLSKDGDKVLPIYNKDFVEAQKHAEYVVTFAAMAKGKDFVGKKAESLADFKAEVASALAKKSTEYVAAPKKVEKTLHKQLEDEALKFISYTEESEKVGKMNEFLQKFNVINEFEEVGLFFEQDIVKMSKIYTIKEITEAVKSIITLL